jgi:serine/threonine protein kinase
MVTNGSSLGPTEEFHFHVVGHPATISTYQLYEKLGQGGFATTYCARETVTGDVCAVKVYSRRTVPLEMIRNEVVPLQKISDRNVVAHRSHGIDGSQTFVVTEFCGDGDLRSLVGKLTENQADDFSRQLFSGLQAIHQANVFHRDLKPENLFLHNGVIKIGDFGISIASDQTVQQNGAAGTRPYMAPEVLDHHMYSSKSDIWSAAVTVAELFTGNRLPNGLLPFDVPQEWAAVLRQCLEQDWKRRPNAKTVCEIVSSFRLSSGPGSPVQMSTAVR